MKARRFFLLIILGDPGHCLSLRFGPGFSLQFLGLPFRTVLRDFHCNPYRGARLVGKCINNE